MDKEKVGQMWGGERGAGKKKMSFESSCRLSMTRSVPIVPYNLHGPSLCPLSLSLLISRFSTQERPWNTLISRM